MARHLRHDLPAILVIFGATGDLMHRKLIPALYNLYLDDQLPRSFKVIGFARREWTDEYFQEQMRTESLEKYVPQSRLHAQVVKDFLAMLTYHQGYFDDLSAYQSLAYKLGHQNRQWQTPSHRLYYLATPPKHYHEIIDHLHESELGKICPPDQGINKILIEKPFGNNLHTAQKLDEFLGQRFLESQIFRIDHYLAKETIQNILLFRFSNAIFEPTWNNQFISQIHIRMFEKIDIQGRGAFYDEVGALRDVGQNHLLQMLALTTMDNPGEFTADAIRQKRHEVMRTLSNIPSNQIAAQTIRAQYQGYQSQSGVNPDSQTETYFKITTSMDHPRWSDVPLIIESGKNLHRTVTDISVTFKPSLLNLTSAPEHHEFHNQLIFRIQPDEGISVGFLTKKPGLNLGLEKKTLEFDYKSAFNTQLPDAYEKILLDAINGDQTLFTHTSELLDSWDFITGITEAWEANLSPLLTYEPGSWGPTSS